MKEKLHDLLGRLSNVGTLIAIVSAVVFILTNCGVVVDNEKVMNIVSALCSIGVLLGVLNNPQTSGVYLPFVNGTKKEEPELIEKEKDK